MPRGVLTSGKQSKHGSLPQFLLLSMNAVFANIKTSPEYFNLGDEASSPLNYFPDWKAETCCITQIDSKDTRPLVLGGGGLFMRGFAETLVKLTERRKVIIWGVGLNYPIGEIPKDLVPALKRCALVGVRDREFARINDFEWVPCSSCLHPLFRSFGFKARVNPAVVYRHGWTAPYLEDFPALTNMTRGQSIEETLHFLASARTVITDSYHGAYWTMLLSRNVIIWKGEAMRFYTGFPSLPIFAHTEDEVRQILAPEASHITAHSFLYRAIGNNQRFADRVCEMITKV